METSQTSSSSSSSSSPPPPIQQWIRKNCIGKGSFGKVHIAVSKSDNQVFAVKSVNSKTASPSHLQALENEIQILQSLSSPYVVNYFGDDHTTESNVECYRNLHLEYMFGGTIVDGGRKDVQTVRSYTRCIASALKYLHSKGIVHCDVKGKNVLVGSSPGEAKLADFGSAQRYVQETGMTIKSIKAEGTPLWMAPEVIRQEKQGPESDVWSLGCTVIEMITGKPAWEDTESTVVFKIGFSDALPEFPATLSELGRDFLGKCLRREPSERWTSEQLLEHPFLSSSNIVLESSPRSILDWDSVEFDDQEESQCSCSESEDCIASAKGRISELASKRGPVWESDGWENVRSSESECNRGGEAGCSGEEKNGINTEYPNLSRERICLELMSLKVESEDRSLFLVLLIEYLSSGCSWASSLNACFFCGFKAGLGWRYGVIKENFVGVKMKINERYYFSKVFLFLIFIRLTKYKYYLLFYCFLQNVVSFDRNGFMNVITHILEGEITM